MVIVVRSDLMERQTMGQERLSAFIDAVIAIIMTILVLGIR